MRGMSAFRKAQCHQCHVVSGHGAPLGPDLTKISARFQGKDLLAHILQPSLEIHKDFQMEHVLDEGGRDFYGVVAEEDEQFLRLIPNLLLPKKTVEIHGPPS